VEGAAPDGGAVDQREFRPGGPCEQLQHPGIIGEAGRLDQPALIMNSVSRSSGAINPASSVSAASVSPAGITAIEYSSSGDHSKLTVYSPSELLLVSQVCWSSPLSFAVTRMVAAAMGISSPSVTLPVQL